MFATLTPFRPGATHRRVEPFTLSLTLMAEPNSLLPKHVAVIMDGNGRWAQKRFLPRVEGHRQGVHALYRVVEQAAHMGIQTLTVFAFSSENWRRPKAEVDTLMKLFALGLAKWEKPLLDADVALQIIGDVSQFPPPVQEAMAHAQALTAAGTRMRLNVAANYGGRWDMLQAAQQVVAQGLELTEANLTQHLCAHECGDVDLLIRTGGEQRISNFLLWQSAYAEIFFSKALWPDFDKHHFQEALDWYIQRERRFGMTSEQVRG